MRRLAMRYFAPQTLYKYIQMCGISQAIIGAKKKIFLNLQEVFEKIVHGIQARLFPDDPRRHL